MLHGEECCEWGQGRVCANLTCLMLWCTAKKGCFILNHWVVTLVAGDSGYGKFLLVYILEVNCISNPSPNHTLQLTTLKTAVSKLLQKIMLLWWFSCTGYYICKIMVIIGALWCMQVWSLSEMHDQWLLYLQDEVWEASSLHGCLMQLEKYTIHNHCPFSLSATRVTPKRTL